LGLKALFEGSDEVGGEGSGDWPMQKDTSLVEAALFCAALGSPCEFVARGVENVGWNGFKKAGGVIVEGLGGGELAGDIASGQCLSDGLVNGSVAGQSSCTG